ncbi:class I SAM-dependent methyltransferase [Ureibacillus chungkukjangi]|uniref:class I SAM-dependent methyltransferase n=1 Tax=Ureibacillus chungkukjangi TaxID=1202712 RepID=UPI00384DBDB8
MKQNIYDNQVFFKQYTALRDSGVTANDFVEQPAIKSLLTAIEGKKVLDLGCGAGAFAKYCVEKGAAKVVAVDISKNMIEKARKENLHEKIDYLCSPIEELDLHNQTFDIIVSSLAIHYIEDYPKLIDKIKSLLIANGEFVFSTEHPLVTARKEVISNWVRDSEGNKLHWAVDHYKQEGKREGYWYVNGVVKYHRTVSTLINTLIEKGLTLERIIEPTSISGGIELRPKLIDEERRPSFIVIKAKKK